MNGPTRIALLGGGGHAAVVAESARRAGLEVVGVAARERPEGLDLAYLGDPDDPAARLHALRAEGVALHAAVGDGALRERWLARFGERAFATVIDPFATVMASARIAPGAFIGARAVVQARADIRASAIVNTGAIVEHDAIVEPCAHVAPGAILCGTVRIGAGALVGAGAVVTPNRIVGAGATVGAGAVVVRDVAAGTTVAGVPAKSLSPDRPDHGQ